MSETHRAAEIPFINPHTMRSPMKQTELYLQVMLIFWLVACHPTGQNDSSVAEEARETQMSIESRFDKLAGYPVNHEAIPRSIDKSLTTLKTTNAATWTSGFFAGNLWYIYHLTGDERYKEHALQWTKILENEKYNGDDHDIGFKIHNSFGHAYKILGNQEYADVLVEAAKTLVSRYDGEVKAIQSWNAEKGKWDFPVIIDNMMNLELLFEASILTNDSSYFEVAVHHANTTLKNHFRDDHSTYHVVDYFPDGSVKARKTHQGYSDSSAWARGQAWAVYGFTMAYRYTKNKAYLEQAEQTALFYLNHQRLPKDGIPFWDFDDPAIPNAPKDVSAATIMASAFLELYEYRKNENYLGYAHKVLENVNQQEYLLDIKVDAPFILKRSTGNYNKNSEIDCPIVYADYYLLEAMLRQKKGLL